MENKLVYLAAPYSHPDVNVRQARFEEVTKVAGALLKSGVHALSPITHCHPIAVHCRMPLSWDYWQGFNETLLRHCSKMMVLKLDGWQHSVGLNAEMKMADALGIEVVYVKKEDFGL